MLIKTIAFKSFDEKVEDRIYEFLKKHSKTQIVDERCVFGKTHAIHSLSQCLKAFRAHSNISKKQEIEFLVRLSGERQIKNALKICMPRKGRKAVFICWSANAAKIYGQLKKNFQIRECKLRESSAKKVKEALEKSATFWL